jgi:hypothetical protein
MRRSCSPSRPGAGLTCKVLQATICFQSRSGTIRPTVRVLETPPFRGTAWYVRERSGSPSWRPRSPAKHGLLDSGQRRQHPSPRTSLWMVVPPRSVIQPTPPGRGARLPSSRCTAARAVPGSDAASGLRPAPAPARTPPIRELTARAPPLDDASNLLNGSRSIPSKADEPPGRRVGIDLPGELQHQPTARETPRTAAAAARAAGSPHRPPHDERRVDVRGRRQTQPPHPTTTRGAAFDDPFIRLLTSSLDEPLAQPEVGQLSPTHNGRRAPRPGERHFGRDRSSVGPLTTEVRTVNSSVSICQDAERLGEGNRRQASLCGLGKSHRGCRTGLRRRTRHRSAEP